jgi:hypothetical protein
MNPRNPSVFARPFSVDNDGGYSRPDPAQTGLDLRTHVAVEAFKAIIASSSDDLGYEAPRKASELAFMYADAFMTEYTRKDDEREAARKAEIAAERDRVRNARYIVVPFFEYRYGGGKMLCRFAYDQRAMRIVHAQLIIGPGGGADGEYDYADTFPVSQLADLSQDIANHDILELTDEEGHGGEATDTLPEWAQNKD